MPQNAQPIATQDVHVQSEAAGAEQDNEQSSGRRKRKRGGGKTGQAKGEQPQAKGLKARAAATRLKVPKEVLLFLNQEPSQARPNLRSPALREKGKVVMKEGGPKSKRKGRSQTLRSSFVRRTGLVRLSASQTLPGSLMN